jgi:hypothetical protein
MCGINRKEKYKETPRWNDKAAEAVKKKNQA